MPKKPRAQSPQVLMHSPVRTPDTPWEFRLYLGPGGRNAFTKWDNGLSAAGRARRNTAMKFLRVEPPQRWDRPHASSLGHNVYVIRFKDQTGFQHRLYGYFDLQHHAFVICETGYEKDSVYFPSGYIERTERCRTDVSMDFNGRTTICPWPLE